jgi:hypothetical protein
MLMPLNLFDAGSGLAFDAAFLLQILRLISWLLLIFAAVAFLICLIGIVQLCRDECRLAARRPPRQRRASRVSAALSHASQERRPAAAARLSLPLRARRSPSPGHRARLFLLLAVVLCANAAARPEDRILERWVPLPRLEGGVVLSLLKEGDRLYAGLLDAGVLVSTDGARSWAEAKVGLGNRSVRALAVAGGRLFAGTDDGVFTSGDGAQKWARTGLAGSDVRAVAAAGERLYAAAANRVFASADGGQSWAQTGPDTWAAVAALAASDAALYAATRGDGVWRSEDAGRSWQSLKSGLPGLYINALAVEGRSLYVAASGSPGIAADRASGPTSQAASGAADDSPTQVLVSGDSGQNWAALGSPLEVVVNGSALRPAVNALLVNGAEVYAATGLGVLLRQGRSWAEAAGGRGLPLGAANALVLTGTTLLAGTAGGVFRLPEGRRAWGAAHAGMGAQRVRALAVVNSVRFVAAGDGGVYFSANGGRDWAASRSGLTDTNGRLLAVTALAAQGGALYAGTRYGGVRRSSDSGQSWVEVNDWGGAGVISVPVLTVGGGRVYAAAGGDVYLLAPDARQWRRLNAQPITSEVRALAVSGSCFCVAAGDAGLLRSTDGGGTWAATAPPVVPSSEASSSPPAGSQATASSVTPTALTVAAKGNYLYASTARGQFVSLDCGNRWAPISAAFIAEAYVFSGDNVYAAYGL